jgi:hypothetical protein
MWVSLRKRRPALEAGTGSAGGEREESAGHDGAVAVDADGAERIADVQPGHQDTSCEGNRTER